MRWRAQETKPIPLAQSIEQNKPVVLVVTGALHQPHAKLVGRIFHPATGGNAGPGTITMDHMRQFVPGRERQPVIGLRKGDHAGGNGDVTVIAVRVDLSIGEQHQSDSAMPDRVDLELQSLAITANVDDKFGTGDRSGNFFEQCIGHKSPGLSSRDNGIDRRATHGNNFVAFAQTRNIGRATGCNTGNDGELVHPERRAKQWPIAPLIGTPVIEDHARIRGLTRAREARSRTQAPFHVRNPDQVASQQDRPINGLGRRR